MPAPSLGLTNTYARDLVGAYQHHAPCGFPAPRLLQLNDALVAELGLDAEVVARDAARLFSGTLVPADAEPLAQAYAGHQFGGFAPQLGDGRAVLLGELRDEAGRLRDLQLKGSGPTVFSRGGDGKATLGPILREYLVSDAMHRLGVPTTRVLAAVATGESVWRRRPEPGAVLARVAASHLRVGTLELFAARGQRDLLERVVQYALARHHPELQGAAEPALALLRAVAKAQARLVARWMHVGFVHGVMNTDNTTLSGETIDYGPCAFMDIYDPATVFSSIDRGGRYAYGNQPSIAYWNLARLGEALLPLLSGAPEAAVERVREALETYPEAYREAYLTGMRDKLGLADAAPDDGALVTDLLAWMHRARRDFTTTFRRLSQGLREGTPPHDDADFVAWHARWTARLGDAPAAAVADRMDAVNPLYIPRNHLVEEALEAAITGDLAPFRTLLAVLSDPFARQPGRERYEAPAPDDFGPYRTFCGT